MLDGQLCNVGMVAQAIGIVAGRIGHSECDDRDFVVSSRWVACLSAVLWSARFRPGSPAPQ